MIRTGARCLCWIEAFDLSRLKPLPFFFFFGDQSASRGDVWTLPVQLSVTLMSAGVSGNDHLHSRHISCWQPAHSAHRCQSVFYSAGSVFSHTAIIPAMHTSLHAFHARSPPCIIHSQIKIPGREWELHVKAAESGRCRHNSWKCLSQSYNFFFFFP